MYVVAKHRQQTYYVCTLECDLGTQPFLNIIMPVHYLESDLGTQLFLNIIIPTGTLDWPRDTAILKYHYACTLESDLGTHPFLNIIMAVH